MKKRNLVIGIIVSVIVGMGVTYAGVRGCHSDQWHKYSKRMGHDTERIVSRIDRKLDLTESQETRIREILDSGTGQFYIGRDIKLTLKKHLPGLDPLSENYQKSVNELADAMARQVREKTLESAEVIRKIAEVLDKNQMDKARKYLERKMEKWEKRHHSGDHDNPDQTEE